MDILRDGLEKLGIFSNGDDNASSSAVGFTYSIEELCKKIETYINEIILFNSAYNLTNTSVHDELVTRHILDSLAPYKIIKNLIEKNFDAENFCMADIGSGGGLPGIPLATVFENVKIELVERMSKRCAFLENCSAVMGLKNVTVVCSEAEKVPAEKYNLITFRAFRPLDEKMIKTLLKIVKKGGYLCAYKAKLQNIEQEMKEIASIVPEYKVEKLTVPGLEDSSRNLVIIQRRF